MSNHSAVAGAPAPIEDADAFVQSTVRYIVYSLVAIVAVVVFLVVLALVASPAEQQSPDLAAQNVAKRIAKVGQIAIQDSTSQGARTGEQVYTAQCAACHTSGALGAPKLGDKAAWAPRIGNGFAALWKSALAGKNSMPAQGGGQSSDLEIARSVVYMANAGGAKFAEPAEDIKPAK